MAPTAAAIAAAFLAALTFHQIFPWSELLAPLALATAAPAAVTATMRRRPAWQPALTSLALWALLTAPVVFHTAPTPHAATQTLRGLRDGWRTILTTVLPIPGRPELLAIAFTATWLTTAMTAELATRTRAAAAPIVPPTVLLVVANVLGAGGEDSTNLLALIAAATTIAALVAMALRIAPRTPRESRKPRVSKASTAPRAQNPNPNQNPSPNPSPSPTSNRSPNPRRSRFRPAAAQSTTALGATAILAIAATALAAAPHLPFIAGAKPFDPKRSVSLPPPAVNLAVSPLDEANSWLTQPNRELFTVRTTTATTPANPATPAPLRLAVFDTFNGATWTTTSRWAPTGGRIPDPSPRTQAQSPAPLTETITISTLTGPWLPTPEQPTDVTGIPITVDPATGVVTADTAPRPGQTYTVHAAPAAPTAAELLAAPVAHDPAAQKALALPTTDANGQTVDAYQALAAAAATATTGATSPYQQASMLEQYLRSTTFYDPAATVGYSYRALQDFVTTAHRGTTVQSAAAFVVMARTLGLPSRIAVGFQPGSKAGDLWHVGTADAMAWPEVDFQGLGWIPFWPTPGAATAESPAAAPPAGSTGDRSTGNQQPNPSSSPSQSQTTDTSGSGSDRNKGASPNPRSATSLPVLPLLAALLLAAYAATVPTIPARRRRRRARHHDPAARIRGAWQQAVEQLADADLVRSEKRRLSALTTSEFVDAASPALDPAAVPHLASLAGIMEITAYAGTASDTVLATQAWWHVTALERLARRRSGTWRHLARRAIGR